MATTLPSQNLIIDKTEANADTHFENVQNLFHLSSNAATIFVGGAPIGLLTKFSVNEDSGQSQLFEIGSPIATEITSGKISVKVSGTLILSTKNKLFEGNFLPKTPYELMAQSMAGVAFQIRFSMRSIETSKISSLGTSAGKDAFLAADSDFLTIHNCRCAKIVSTIDSNKQIENNFEAVGQYLGREIISTTTGTKYKPTDWATALAARNA